MLRVLTIVKSKILRTRPTLVSQTQEVLYTTEQVLTLVVDIETGARRFLPAGKEEFLEPLLRSSKTVQTKLDDLQRFTSDNPNQQPRMDSLRNLISKRIENSNYFVAQGQREGDKAIFLIDLGKGKNITDNIRTIVSGKKYMFNQIFYSWREAIGCRQHCK